MYEPQRHENYKNYLYTMMCCVKFGVFTMKIDNITGSVPNYITCQISYDKSTVHSISSQRHYL